MPNRHHHYIEIQTAHMNGGKLVTRIPTEDFEESKRAVGLIAAEFFPDDPNAPLTCVNGQYHYESMNDHGDNVRIAPVISPFELATGESMNELSIPRRLLS